MNAQFQLGLELTNILTPLTSAVSALGSLAVARAIKQAGSDALTELELASFLGRNRIDASLQLHFRQIVGRTARTPLCRALDIVLDAGAGPTVQNALQNPELLSMVVQLSLLCSVYEESSLAQVIIEAIERNLKELKGDLGRVPHYPSLCGTLRVCKQETADFQWHHLFDAVEAKIASAFNAHDAPDTSLEILKRPSIADRIMHFPVLQILLMCLHSLQYFPEERLLNIECQTGITTIIAWCYHVLGLSVKLTLCDREINFGDSTANVFIRESSYRESRASLLHPSNIHEPLFDLTSKEGDPRIGPDLRKPVRGYGNWAIKQSRSGHVTKHVLQVHINWVISQSIKLFRERCSFPNPESAHLFPESMAWDQRRSNTECAGLTESQIVGAVGLLFDFEPVDEEAIKKNAFKSLAPTAQYLDGLSTLVDLVLSIARVETEDLENCSELPLSVQTLRYMSSNAPASAHIDLGLEKAFDTLARYFQGPQLMEAMNSRSILVSNCGWSLYFNSINSSDPAEIIGSSLRIVRGVPARRNVKKSRVVDGPTTLKFSPSQGYRLQSGWNAWVPLFPGVSKSNRQQAFCGHEEPDAFQITQAWEWHYQGTTPRKHLLGLREMVRLCLKFVLFSPCHCKRDSMSIQDVAEIYLKHEDLGEKASAKSDGMVSRVIFGVDGSTITRFLDNDASQCTSSFSFTKTKNDFKEYVFCAQTGSKDRPTSETWLFHVTDNPASRWMELCDINPQVLSLNQRASMLFLRGPDTCLRCAFEAIVPPKAPPPLQPNGEYCTVFVLL